MPTAPAASSRALAGASGISGGGVPAQMWDRFSWLTAGSPVDSAETSVVWLVITVQWRT